VRSLVKLQALYDGAQYRYIRFLVLVIVATLITSVLLVVRVQAGLFTVVSLLAILMSLFALGRPVTIFYTVITISSLSSIFREVAIPVSNTEMTLSGLLWLAVAGFSALFLLVNARRLCVPHYVWPFMAFFVWTVIRWLLTPTWLLGLKDVLWYSMPALFGLFVPLALSKREKTILASVNRVERALLCRAWVPVVVYAIALLTGLAEMTPRGPRGDLVGSARGTPLYLLVVLAVALANWRCGPRKNQGRFFSLLSLGAIFFTLARMASLLGLTIFFTSRTNPRRKWQVVGSLILAGLTAFYAITHIPVLQQRFFFTEDWEPSMGLTAVNTAGRKLMWPAVFASATQKPYMGRGLGTARLVTGRLFAGKKDVEEYPPHNEYLQVFHDLGIVGLGLIVIAWGNVFWTQWRSWKSHSDPLVKKWGMASILAIGSLLVSSVTDNTMHYPIVMVPVMIATLERGDTYSTNGCALAKSPAVVVIELKSALSGQP